MPPHHPLLRLLALSYLTPLPSQKPPTQTHKAQRHRRSHQKQRRRSHQDLPLYAVYARNLDAESDVADADVADAADVAALPAAATAAGS